VQQASSQQSPLTGLVRHLAIIMDGNNRWARRHGLSGEQGHGAGEEAVHAVVRAAAERNIEVLTLFAFSSENWRRPDDEVNHLMHLFMKALGERVEELHQQDVRLRFIGERAGLDASLCAGMDEAQQRTADNQRMTVVVAINYGGQWDIARAARRLAEQVERGERTAESITSENLDAEICLSDLPAPEMIIRTAGEQRLSNFLLWQAAYSEFWFTDELWPDFGAETLDQALADFGRRKRRFGGRSDTGAEERH
jgi:undecaprenyl diphosphate synthase